jgi:hypothetical protein
MSHGRDCPSMCSLCAGVVPRKVEQRDDVLVIDGVAVRPIAPEPGPGLAMAARRGGRERALRSAPRRVKR